MSPADELKVVFTQYWHFMALRGACRLGIFDAITQHPGIGPPELAGKLCLHKSSLRLLLLALVDFGVLQIREKGGCYLTEKGQLLTDGHPQSLKNACLLWGEEHLDAWRHLPESVQTGLPAFELAFGAGFFEYLSKRPGALENYQLAMSEYARGDYVDLTGKVDFSKHAKVADVGGGYGTVAELLAAHFPKNKFIVFDRPEVVAGKEKTGGSNLQYIGGDFFHPLPFSADAIVLARVLHDWPDDAALRILQNCHLSLAADGRLYILEILQEKTPTPALDLHMALICGSRERSSGEYAELLKKTGFELLETQPLNGLQSILIAQKF